MDKLDKQVMFYSYNGIFGYESEWTVIVYNKVNHWGKKQKNI